MKIGTKNVKNFRFENLKITNWQKENFKMSSLFHLRKLPTENMVPFKIKIFMLTLLSQLPALIYDTTHFFLSLPFHISSINIHCTWILMFFSGEIIVKFVEGLILIAGSFNLFFPTNFSNYLFASLPTWLEEATKFLFFEEFWRT